MRKWDASDPESKDLILVGCLDLAVLVLGIVAFYFIRVFRAARLSDNLLTGDGQSSIATHGRLASRPKVGFDIGKDTGFKVISRLWSVDLEVLSVRCGVNAATFLRFNKMLCMLSFYMCLFLFPVLAYVYDKGDGSHKGYSAMTVSALSAKENHNWWLLTSAVLVVSFVGTIFINQFTRHVRLTYLLGRTKAPVSNFGIHITQWPSTACRDKDQQKLFKEFERQYKGEVVAVHIIPDVRHIMDAELESSHAAETLEKYQAMPGNPTCRDAPVYMFGATVDAVKHWKQVLASRDGRVAEARREYESAPRGTGDVFVTFNEIKAARACISDMVEGKFSLEFKYTGPNEGKVARVDANALSVRIAPNPDDIMWRNLGVPRNHFLARRIFVILAIALAVFLWVTPVMFLTVAPELHSVKYGNIGSMFRGLDKVPFPISAIVFRYFPSLFLFVAGLFLSDLCEVAAKLEAQPSRGERDRSVLKWSTAYNVLSSLVFPVFWLLYLGNLSSYPEKSWSEISEDMYFAENGTFFLHFILHAASIGTVISLIRPRDLVLTWIASRSGTISERARAAAPPFFPFAAEFSNVLTVFTIVLALCPVMPMVLPLGFAYFFLKYWSTKFVSLYFYTNRTTDDGHTPQSAAYCSLVAIGIMQAIFCVFLRGRGQMAQFGTVLPCIVLIVIVIGLTMVSRRNLTMTPIELGENSIAEDSVDLIALRSAYAHPSVSKWQAHNSQDDGNVTLDTL